MGYTIPHLRNIRATAIGTERAGHINEAQLLKVSDLYAAVPEIEQLPARQTNIVHKYTVDASCMLIEMRRVLNDSGKLVVVLADFLCVASKCRT